jgi:hypothetical protein
MYCGGGSKLHTHRNITFNRNFENITLISKPSKQSCVNIIDGQKIEISSRERSLVHMVAPYSKIDNILVNSESQIPPTNIFGTEPEHTWCYFYQKASLARQIGDWEEVLRLEQNARAKNLGPYDYHEWMPFFEAHVNLGNEKEARNLAKIIKTDYGARNQICKSLDTYLNNSPDYDYDLILEILCQ